MKVKGAVKVKATEQKRGIPGPPNLVPPRFFHSSASIAPVNISLRFTDSTPGTG